MKIGSLFSGVGGLDLACERVFNGETVWQCEIEPHPQRVLRARWPDAVLHADVRKVSAATATPVDVLCGGFPCQNLSVAGKREGLEGEKSGLYREMMRIVGELKPQYVVIENVPALLTYRHELDDKLRALGYGAIWQTIAAEDVGAPHRRLRVFVVAVRGLSQWRLLPRPGPQGDLFAPWVDATPADGLWPTATRDDHATMYAQGGEPLGHAVRWPTPSVCGNHNRKGASATSGDGLATAAKWPTPRASFDAGMGSKGDGSLMVAVRRPTPAARDWKDSGHEPSAQARNSPCLPASAVMASDRAPGVLNPAWVELLMGLPTGWTAPDEQTGAAHAWPAGRGEPQRDHEPPRLVPPKSVRDRGARLKALGNAVVPQQAETAIRRALASLALTARKR